MGMPYNMTFFPNMMEHYDQDIAASLMEVSCHEKINQTVNIYVLIFDVIFDCFDCCSVKTSSVHSFEGQITLYLHLVFSLYTCTLPDSLV